MKYLTIWVSLVTTVAADSFFLVGRGESSTPKQRVKKHLSINRRGGGVGRREGVMRTARRSWCPLPIAYSSSRAIQVFWQNRSSTIPYPAFRFSCWRAAWALCKWDQLRGFDCRSERRGAEGSSEVTGLVERLDRLPPQKMHWAPLQQCFAAVTWSVLYFSEWRS